MAKDNDDPVGKKFWRLTLLRVIPPEKDETTGKWRRKLWVCSCECGNETTVHKGNVIAGYTKSCGCLAQETRSSRAKHKECLGGKMSQLYAAWNCMMQRCYNPKRNRAKRYLDRGIKVCERWKDPHNFFKDMGPHPGKGFSLDRIDNDGDYSPENCRWSTVREQSFNTSSNIIVEGKTLLEWEKSTGIPADLLRGRLSAGWGWERILRTPRRIRGRGCSCD